MANLEGYFPLENRLLLFLRGQQSLDLLHRITTSNLKSLPLHHHKKTIFTSEKGRFVDFTSVIHLDEGILLLGGEDKSGHLQEWIDKYIIIEDITIDSSTFTAGEIYHEDWLRFIESSANKNRSQVGELIKIENEEGNIFVLPQEDGNSCLVFSEQKYQSAFQSFVNSICEQQNLKTITQEEFHHWRILQGMLMCPYELGKDVYPNETPLLKYVDFNKGCYIGQEVVARLDTYEKVQKQFTQFRIVGRAKFMGDKVNLSNEADQNVGWIYSATCGGDESIGLGYLKKKFLETEQFYVTINESKLLVTKNNSQ